MMMMMQAYIVYMGSLPGGEYSPTFNHLNMLQQVLKQSFGVDSLIRSYKRSFNGFVAKLTNEEAKKLANMKEVVSVFPNQILHLHTTRSWDFMGFTSSVRRNTTIETDVIIGVLDSGIWPESPSFSDEGFGPAPKKWKGTCKGGKNFTCNNKIIGARFYQSIPSIERSATARDIAGHGSHTASIAAGNEVKGASFLGLAQGTARGGVPSARIAAYKVCNQDNGGCTLDDVLVGFDDAIADGVDILTVSLGGAEPVDFFSDVIAIGSFHAMEKGILTLNSVGNNGGSVFASASVAPWMLSVAASSTDRKFIDKVVLGNGNTLTGFSVNPFASNGTKLPIVYGHDVSRNCSEQDAGRCSPSCLDSHLVQGKITVCDQLLGFDEAHRAGAAGSIAQLLDQYDNVSFVMAFPAVALNPSNYFSVKSYMNSTKNPVAEILRSETIKDLYSPMVAPFSSLGPNAIVPDILKPDITAPGVEILAAYSPLAPPSETLGDKRQVQYNILSGTSMSCPHVAGVAAYVKTFHPDWSPSAIKSAIMTTAWPMDKSKNPMGEFSYGAGHINPVKAIDPGLVYEAFKEDYIKLMCSLGYSLDNIKQVSGNNSSCPTSSENVPPRDLNYPSLTASVLPNQSFAFSFHRTVKNVGHANSTYKAKVSPNPKLNVKVVPEVLSFKALEEKKSFNVTVSGRSLEPSVMLSTMLIWSDGVHITYIVYMGSLSEGEISPASNHLNMLQQSLVESSGVDSLIRSYKRSFHGFAAKLTDEEAKNMAKMKGVVSVFPDQIIELHTTRSWDFMGFADSVKRNPAIESDVIIGVLDSGIWPESPSFSDQGFGPVPKKWKGACKGGQNFTCNNKIIGARFYQSKPSLEGSARDEVGHGTHTASIAAGNEVKDASLFGLAQGTARGAVPSARIAAYNVCGQGCALVNVLAGFDDAIADGVDMITLSMGGIGPIDLFSDVIAIGSFHAMEKGILTLNSVGNSGGAAFGLTSVAPWMLSVAASTTDRKFIDKVVLGNGQTLTGLSVNTFASNGTKLPIVYGRAISTNCSEQDAGNCFRSCIDSNLVKGKITLCDQLSGYAGAYHAGAAGSIVQLQVSDQSDNVSVVMPLPAVALETSNYNLVKSYMNSTKNTVAEILRSETIKDLYSPVVAEFSSLGPNPVVLDILKPDITAPGVNILAAYSPLAPLSEIAGDKMQVNYNVLSGTSMSCPHVAGVAAYVKTFHPDWSPSAIKSAIMTTAWPMDKSKNPNGEISYGAGHVNPVKAIDPGLVYEAFEEEYVKLMCSLGYSLDNIKRVSGDNSTCPKSTENVPPRDLNYPSLTSSVPPNQPFTLSFHRTVKNVGLANSIYKAQVSPDQNLNVQVVPNVLSFKALEEKQSFVVTVSGGGLKSQSLLSTTLTWSDGVRIVRSPVVVHSYPRPNA
ncbi:hypothetical protein PTKIN_Ptkin03bG0040600 [Pterospermum kingtungense]